MKCLAVNVCIIMAMMLLNSISNDSLLGSLEISQKQNQAMLNDLQKQYSQVIAEGAQAAKNNLVAMEAHSKAVKELEEAKKKLEEKMKSCR